MLQHSKVDELKRQLVLYLRHTSTSDHAAKYPTPANINADEMSSKRTAEVLRDMFVNDDWRSLAPLVRLLFSMPATSAAAERVFSSSGRICSPLRSRMSAVNVERLTMLQQFIAKSDKGIAEITKAIVDYATVK